MLLKGLLRSLKDLVSDVNLYVAKDGLNVTTMDSSHVCLCKVHIPIDLFESWSLQSACAIGINTATICNVLNCLTGQILILEYDGDCLYISSNDDKGEQVLNFFTLDIEEHSLDVPDYTVQAHVHMDASEFAELCTNSLKFGENGEFCISVANELTISTCGDQGSYRVIYHMEDKSRTKIETHITSPQTYRFSWRYLQLFSKAKTLSDTISFEFACDKPLKTIFRIRKEVVQLGGEISFYLAPIIV